MKPDINSARPARRPPPTEQTEIDSFPQFWPRHDFKVGDAP